MRKTLHTTLCLVLLACFLQGGAQEQYASRLIKYSSQSGPKAFGARQVLGKPNALEYGKNPVAWAPLSPNLGEEYVEVGFDRPMRIRQVAVWENFNPGAIYQIFLVDPDGRMHQAYERSGPPKRGSGSRVFRYMMDRTDFEVAGLRLVLQTDAVYGLNQIDAIGISSSGKPMEAVINVPADKSYMGKPENLGYTVNCEDPDMLPIISVDGQHLYFARKHHAQNTGPGRKDDIYVSRRTSHGGWTEAVNIGPPLNNEYNNFVCAANPDGTQLLISGRYDYRGQSREGPHTTSLRNGRWTEPVPIVIEGYNNLSPFVCYHVSPDMEYLVIAMEHPDTYGDMDIYVSFLQPNGSYSKPKNLGPHINTAGTEPSVFLSADGRTIYFSSDGHPGYGAYDMYMSRRTDNSWNNWTEPVNLGPEINSADWDLYYTVPSDGEYAYYSSEFNSYGRSDLYRVRLPKDVRPEPVLVVQPSFVDARTNAPVERMNNEQKPIILHGDSRVELYEEVKGYYPVNETVDLSAELEEEDDFGQLAHVDPEKRELESRIDDLLAELQELKKEQAKTATAIETAEDLEAPAVPAAPGVVGASAGLEPETSVQPSELDNRLADLRSQMDRLSKEEATGPSVGVETNSHELPADRAASQEAEAPDDYMAAHLDYRSRIEELKQQQAGVSAQPLSKYAIGSPSRNREKDRELASRSLSSELEAIRQRAGDPDAAALAEYQRKLDAVRNGQPTAGGNGTTPKKTVGIEVDDEAVLAYRQKLDELKNRMESLPEHPGDDIAVLPESSVKRGRSSVNVDAPAPQEADVREPRPRRFRNEPDDAEVVDIIMAGTLAEQRPPEDAGRPVAKADPYPAGIPGTEGTTVKPVPADTPTVPETVTTDPERARQLEVQFRDAQERTEAAKRANEEIEQQNQQLQQERDAMAAEKQALEDAIAQLERERRAFLEEQQQLENQRRQLEQLRLDQHRQVRQLENEIAALENEKGVALAAANDAKAAAPLAVDPTSEIFLMPLEKGVTVEIRNVFFSANSFYIKPQSYEELDKVVAFLRVNSNISVEIGGHTNGLCDSDFCNSLSEKRAKAVTDYIVNKGIAEQRVAFKGYGKQKPVANNNSAEGRKANQRVELKIIEVK